MVLLNQRFFKLLSTKEVEGNAGCIYECYQAINSRSTMVLFSKKTATPLAALMIQAEDLGCMSMITGRPSPGDATEPYFQGMLNMNDQPFSFVISNLSDKGMFNFNILHTPHRVSEVDPGPAFGINKVNELHKNQSYVIAADQRNSRQLILSGKTKMVVDKITKEPKQVPETVGETEAKVKPTGLYFYLSVVPDKFSKELIAAFAEGTVWRAAPGFVRKATKTASITQKRSHEQSVLQRRPAHYVPLRMRRAVASNSGQRRRSYGDITEVCARTQAMGVERAEAMGSQRQAQAAVQRSRGSFARRRKSAAAPPSQAQSSVAKKGPDPLQRPTRGCTSTARENNPKSDEQKRAAEMANALDWLRSANGDTMDEGFGCVEIRDAPAPVQKSECFGAAPVNIGSTQAGELKYGHHVNVSARKTGHDYMFEHFSEPTVLCLSIWEEMEFLPLLDLEKNLKNELEDFVKNEGKLMIESLNAIYKIESCAIDLESEADTIICTCGHQCINHANVDAKLRRCPLCRSPITAFVKADGILLHNQDASFIDVDGFSNENPYSDSSSFGF
mmetsp:Transcript_12353/g.19896  ORF Transcript_12353/g.19896 Transcript_12353/m.19896 type:complete len:560 (+) Transcript_12353:77-1756(+)